MPQHTEHFPPLQRRPDAQTITVRALIEKVRRGEVRVPHFQRPLRWRRDHVRELLDSILRGYPIGSLLVWKRRGPKEVIRVGNASLKVEEVADAWYVVDGQQRITALAASLLDLDQGADATWEHYLDPDESSIRSGSPPAAREGIDVPVRVLGELTRLSRWLRQHRVDDELRIRRVEAVQQTLLDYSLPLYVVETDDQRALRGVFARLNSTGARMRADEVFHALLGGDQATGEGLQLTSLQEACDIDGFGSPPRTEVLKAVFAMSEVESTKRSDRLDARDLERLVTEDAARESLVRTVRFFREVVGIPLYRLIPYPVVFVILSRFFYLFGDEIEAMDDGDSVLRELARWLWRGAAIGVHQRAEVSKMREQVRALRPNELQSSVRRLLEFVRAAAVPPWDLQRFDQRSARSRIELLALLELKPRDLFGPLETHLLNSEERLATEIYSVTRYKGQVDPDIRSVANRALLGARDTNLHVLLRESCDPEVHADLLRSHLIDNVSFELLVQGDVEGFLKRRGSQIRELVSDFLRRRAQFDQPTTLPLPFYLFETDNANAV